MTGIVALSAAQGTGKTELAIALATRLDGPHASVSAYITSVLQLEGHAPSPQLLRERGEQLAHDPNDLVSRVLSNCDWTTGLGTPYGSPSLFGHGQQPFGARDLSKKRMESKKPM